MNLVQKTVHTINDLIEKSKDKNAVPSDDDIGYLVDDIENVESEMDSICQLLENTLLAKRYSVYNALNGKQSKRMEEC